MTDLRGPRRLAAFTALATLLLLAAGGLVTTTGSGLAVPDWPLSFGSLWPFGRLPAEMKAGVWYEHTHRLLGAFVGILALALAIWLSRSPVSSGRKRLAWILFAAVVFQGLLGGATVLFGLPAGSKAISIVHAGVGQIVFCLAMALAVLLESRGGMVLPTQTQKGTRLFWMGATCACLLFLQVLFGARLRHTGEGLLSHLIVAAAATALLLYWGSRLLKSGILMDRSATIFRLLGLLGVQILLGALSWTARLPGIGPASVQADLVIRTGHMAAGALLLAGVVILTLRTRLAA